MLYICDGQNDSFNWFVFEPWWNKTFSWLHHFRGSQFRMYACSEFFWETFDSSSIERVGERGNLPLGRPVDSAIGSQDECRLCERYPLMFNNVQLPSLGESKRFLQVLEFDKLILDWAPCSEDSERRPPTDCAACTASIKLTSPYHHWHFQSRRCSAGSA